MSRRNIRAFIETWKHERPTFMKRNEAWLIVWSVMLFLSIAILLIAVPFLIIAETFHEVFAKKEDRYEDQ